MKRRSSLLLISLVFLSSCTMYPKYERPEQNIPVTWKYEFDEGLANANIGWWKNLNDPVLDSYIIEALANNQDYKVAIYRVEEYVARLGIVRSELYPQLTGQAAGGRNKISTTLQPITPGIQAISNAFALVLNASFELDVWGKIQSASDSAKADLLSQIYNRQTVVLTLVSSVASTYIDIRTLDRQLVIAYETKAAREESYYLAKVRFDLGLTSKMQVEQARSEVDEAKAVIDRLEIELGLKEDLFCFLLGKAPEKVARGKMLEELFLPSKVPAFLPSELVSQRPDILAAEQELIAANADIGVARARFFPQFSLTGALGTESSLFNQLFTSPSNVWQYGLSLLQEIFTGGRLTSGLKLSKAKKMDMLHNYESILLNAFKEVNDALISHQKTLDLVKVQMDSVEAYTQYFYLATLRYNEGQTDYLTYLDAERRLFDAQLSLAKAQGDSFTTLIELYKALGGGWVFDADNEALDLNFPQKDK